MNTIIKKNRCLGCKHLFKLFDYNRIRFCDGREGAYIDNYPDREGVLKHFETTQAHSKSPSCAGVKVFHSQFIKDDFFYPQRLSCTDTDLGHLPKYHHRIFCFPTFNCNNNCRHCLVSEEAKKNSLSLEQAKSMVSKYSRVYPFVHIGGGEPTLFKGLIELIRFCKDLDKRIILFSNCKRMAEPDFAKKIAASGLNKVTVPLHAADAKTHDYITRRPGSFKETLLGIKNLKKFGMKNIQAIVVVHKKNYRQLKKIAEFLVRIKVDSVSLESLIYCGRTSDNLNSLKIKVSKTAKLIEKFFDILIDAGIPFCTTSLPLCLFNKRYWSYFINERYSLLTTNITRQADSNLYQRHQTAGTRLAEKCIDCRLKLFCPGLWGSYYGFFGDRELSPVSEGEISNIIKFTSRAVLEKIFRPANPSKP